MRLSPVLLALLLVLPGAARAAQAEPPADPAKPAAADAPPTAPAEAPQQASPAPGSAEAAKPAAEEDLPQFALGLTVGAPDGAVLSFSWAPWWWIMADAGFAYTLAPGFVLGVEVQPIDFVISPTLRGEYGYYFAGNTADQIKKWAGVPESAWPLIGNASYNWFSGLVGFALGSRRGFTFRLEGGVGWISLNVKGGSANVGNVGVTASEWSSKAFMPVARLSFVYFF
jgi:hypothetical protein